MILDRLENAGMYCTLGAEVALALNYLRVTDFSQVPDGRYELDGDRVYAVVCRYRPKPPGKVQWEAHRRYLDVQYVAQGAERLGHTFLHNGLNVRKDYDPQNDLVIYDGKGDFVAIRAGSFAILAPHDIHAPGVAMDPPEASGEVCKVVVKCRLQDG